MLNAGNIAGINEKTMLASLQDMSGKMGAIMTGKLSVEQGTAMGVLGLGIDTEKDKKAPAILSDIVNAALKQARALDPNERDYQSKLESKRVWATQAGGDTAGMFFDYLMNPNSSIHSMGALLAAGRRTNTLEARNDSGALSAAKGATHFSEANSKLGNVLNGYGKDLAGDVGGAADPLISKLTDWLIKNEPTIVEAIDHLSDILSGISDMLSGLLPKSGNQDKAKAKTDAADALRSVGINPAMRTSQDISALLANPKAMDRWFKDTQAAGGPGRVGSLWGTSPELAELYHSLSNQLGKSWNFSSPAPLLGITTGDKRSAHDRVFGSKDTHTYMHLKLEDQNGKKYDIDTEIIDSKAFSNGVNAR
jgi:hypothetical protein